MNEVISVSSIIIAGVATIINIIQVAKRYKELKRTKDRKQIYMANNKLKDANKILVEIEKRNNGVIRLDGEQKNELEQIIKQIDIKLNESSIEKKKSC